MADPVVYENWKRKRSNSGKLLLGLKEQRADLTEVPLVFDDYDFVVLDGTTFVEIPGCQFVPQPDSVAIAAAAYHNKVAADAHAKAVAAKLADDTLPAVPPLVTISKDEYLWLIVYIPGNRRAANLPAIGDKFSYEFQTASKRTPALASDFVTRVIINGEWE